MLQDPNPEKIRNFDEKAVGKTQKAVGKTKKAVGKPKKLLEKLFLLHPRKWRTRAPVLTGGPGAAPGGVASKNGWVYMRVRGESISYSLVCPSVCVS